MTANVRIVVDSRPAALKVPNAALRFRPAGVEADPLPARGGGGVPGGAPESGRGEAGGGPEGGRASPEAMRERLVKGLGLSQEQQQKLDPILQESRQQFRALMAQDLPEEERRRRGQRIREATQARIREILTPEQQARYAEIAGGPAGAGGARAGRVWILGPDGRPAAVMLQLGITDGTTTEVLTGPLVEGAEVLTGLAPGAAPTPTAPTQPRLRL
jgi:HlyD family secretion protein